jgi:hypothetical protein
MIYVSVDIFNTLIGYINKKYFINENSLFLYTQMSYK